MKKLVLTLAAAVALVPFLAQGQPLAQGGPGLMRARGGIPPAVAQKIGVPEAAQKRIRQMALEANEQLITLDAELKRARLELERLLEAERPDSNALMQQIDKVARAEAEVRKNRMGLMLRIREALGPQLWQKLQAEMAERRPAHRRRGPGKRGQWGEGASPGGAEG